MMSWSSPRLMVFFGRFCSSWWQATEGQYILVSANTHRAQRDEKRKIVLLKNLCRKPYRSCIQTIWILILIYIIRRNIFSIKSCQVSEFFVCGLRFFDRSKHRYTLMHSHASNSHVIICLWYRLINQIKKINHSEVILRKWKNDFLQISP